MVDNSHEQYRLVELGNSELLAGLSELVRQSNVLSAQLLAHLVELEVRMLHLELGFSSLFAYCVEALGMSEGSAGRRVTAARVCRRFPEAFERVARGELHLCALCALAPHLNPENVAELLEASRSRTRRQVEELLAVRFPRPDVREQIRRLAVRTQVPVPPNEASDARRRAREFEPLSADRFGVHFTADAELRDLIERARALASHRLPNGDLASLMKLMAARFVRQEEKRRFGVGARPRRVKTETETETETETTPARTAERQAPPGGVEVSAQATGPRKRELSPVQGGMRGRYLSVAVRRETHVRDRARCAFVSADGRRCEGRAFLEFDHVKPFARLGAPDAVNIRLLCQAHNLLHARNCFGTRHVAAKIAARKGPGPATR